jgi:hypothetical protein
MTQVNITPWLPLISASPFVGIHMYSPTGYTLDPFRSRQSTVFGVIPAVPRCDRIRDSRFLLKLGISETKTRWTDNQHNASTGSEKFLEAAYTRSWSFD